MSHDEEWNCNFNFFLMNSSHFDNFQNLDIFLVVDLPDVIPEIVHFNVYRSPSYDRGHFSGLNPLSY